MAQEYRVKDVKKGKEWSNDFGTFQGYALSFEGIGEPVSLNKKVPVNSEPMPGDTLYGTLESVSTQSGRMYYKFKSEQRPSGTQSVQRPMQDSDGMYRCNALNNSVAFLGDSSNPEKVLDIAEMFYQWLKNGKQSNEEKRPDGRDWASLGKPKTPAEEVMEITGGEEGNVDLSDIPF